MQRLGSVLESLLVKTGIQKPILQNKALFIWSEVVGETIAKNATAEEIKHGNLIVKTSTPVWKNELAIRKREILAKINKRLGQKVIRDIKLI